MGCICSKGAAPEDEIHASDRDKQLNISSVQLVAPAPSLREHPGGIVVGNEGSVRRGQQQQQQPGLKANVTVPFDEGENPRTTIVERPKRNRHQRCATMDMGMGTGTETTIVAVGLQPQMSRIVCLPVGPEGDEVVAGWPSWLTSVAGEAIKGWQPRRADAFEKIDKVSSCYCLFHICCLLSWMFGFNLILRFITFLLVFVFFFCNKAMILNIVIGGFLGSLVR